MGSDLNYKNITHNQQFALLLIFNFIDRKTKNL